MTALSFDLLEAPQGATSRWLLFCHGILGRGANWRGFARRVLAEVPGLGAILVDLRAHGASRNVPPPDSVAAAAQDLRGLIAAPPIAAHPVTAALGHSFGGKVVIALSQDHPLEHLFVVDSMPGRRTITETDRTLNTARVVKMLRTIPARFHSRAAFLSYVQGLGFSKPLALWLGQNLDALEGGYEFGLDIGRIESLLSSFFEMDLWDALAPPAHGAVAHLVVAGRSSAFSEEERARAWELAAAHERVHVSVLETADHWVHIDDPDGLLEIVEEALT